MITLDQFLESCAHETRILQHLATKLPEGALEYRPTAGQRSTLELMRYMARMAAVPMARAVDGTWGRAEALEASTATMPPERFAGELDEQLLLLRADATQLAGRDLAREACSMPWGTPCTLGEFLVNAVLKCYAAYRMQFFLYLKAAGATDLGPAQCWVGIDPPPASSSSGA